MIGENADQMCLSGEILVHPTKEIPKVYSLNTCLGELMRDPKAQAVMAPFMQEMAQMMQQRIWQKRMQTTSQGL